MTTETSSTPAPEKPATKKGGIGKWIFRIFGTLVVLVVLLLVGLYLFRNTLVKMGVERGGKYATLQDTILDSANLSLGDGSLELSSLGIKNPNPYKESHFLSMKSCKVGVDSGSLLTNNVHVKDISIDGLEIWLEQNGLKSNLGDILDIINKQTAGAPAAAGSGGETKPVEATPGKNLTVDVIRLTNAKVHVRGFATLDFDLGSFEIAQPTNPDGRPMKIANVIGTVLLRVAEQIAKNPQLPAGFKDSLKDVDKILANVTKGLPKDLDKMGKDLGKDLGKGLQDATKGLDMKNLNPFDKKK